MEHHHHNHHQTTIIGNTTTFVEESSTPSKSKSRNHNHPQHRRSTSWNNMMYGYSSNSNNNNGNDYASTVAATASHLNLPELKPNDQTSSSSNNPIMINRIMPSSRNYNNNSSSSSTNHTNVVNNNKNSSMMMFSALNKDTLSTSTSRSPGGKNIIKRWMTTTATTSIVSLFSTKKKHPIAIAICFGMILVYWFCTMTVAFTRINNPSLTVSDNGNSNDNNNKSNSIIASAPPPGLIRGVNVVSSNTGGGVGVVSGISSSSSSSHSIPLPLPKQLVSVVLMNFSRPRMIRESSMMRTLLSHPNVDEVLLLHANPKAAFEFVHPKVVNIDAVEHNDEMGLSLRFYFCQLAKHPWVIHLDDDMEFTSEALNELLIEYGRNPHRIVGRFGRDFTPGNSFQGYNSKQTTKTTEVVLTKLMVVERDICSSFFEYAHLVWDFILSGDEGPLWNGEDIFMSLVANHVYKQKQRKVDLDGQNGNNNSNNHNNNQEGEYIVSDQHEESLGYNNYAMDWLNVWQADDSLKDYENGKNDISGGLSGYKFWDWRWWQSLLRRNRHYSYRGKLWQIARDRLNGMNDE